MKIACPPRKTLHNYLTGKTMDCPIEVFESHLAVCLRCQADLEVLSEESDSVTRLIAAMAKVPQLSGNVDGEVSQSFGHFSPSVNKANSMNEHPWEDHNDRLIRDYRILECIGQGGMGSVYRALDIRLNRFVAVKILSLERMGTLEAVSRFSREMRLLAQLKHRHIVQIFEGGEQNGVPYFVMELVNGVNLSQLVRRLGPLPVPEACSIIQLAASALQYAHDQKVIHRDIKPSNLMVTAMGDLQLLDLGLAQILEAEGDEAVSSPDQVLGTFAYMSPEQRAGGHQITSRSDIFSLGITLYELLTAQKPIAPLHMQPLVSDIRSIRPDVDKDLSSLVRDMIAVDPSQRPNSMAEVESRLSEISTANNLRDLIVEYYRWDNSTQHRTHSNNAEGHSKTKKSRRTNGTRFRLLGSSQGILVLALVCAVGALLATLNYPMQTGRVEVHADTGLGSDLRSEVIAIHSKTGKRIPLIDEGAQAVPIGIYNVELGGPDEFFNERRDFEVFEGRTTKLSLKPTFAKFFQYPDIPNKAGAYAIYHGPLWRTGWEENGTPFSFKIYFEVLAIEDSPGLPATKWLQIDVIGYDDENDYRESAVLNIDSKRWDNDNVLDIKKGWVEAKSSKIREFMKKIGNNDSIVVPFSGEHDLIAENGVTPLPKRRLSVQDVLSLFFGQEMPGAGKSINFARSRLPSLGERNAWIETVHDARGVVSSYAVSSRKKGEPKTTFGFKMVRRRCSPTNPFGFLQLEVNTPDLRADCVIIKCGEGEADAGRTDGRIQDLSHRSCDLSNLDAGNDLPPVEGLAENPLEIPKKRPRVGFNRGAEDLTGLKKWLANVGFSAGLFLSRSDPSLYPIPSSGSPSSVSPSSGSPAPISQPPVSPTRVPAELGFDRGVVPRVPSMQVYHGTIAMERDREEIIRATIKMLGEEQIEDRLYSWIEVDVTTNFGNEPTYREAARVLIDAEIYRNSGDFSIRRGWIAFENSEAIFALPADGDLESLVDLRLPLQRKLKLNRIGVSHVLSMLFNADLKPRNPISQLRPKFAGQRDRESRGIGIQTNFFHPLMGNLECLVYETPPLLKSFGMHYFFRRSAKVPFGFETARLKAQNIDINLETENCRSLDPKDFPPSLFGERNSTSESKLVAKSLQKSSPNWRVWTWSDSNKTYKAWAEFGGTIDSSSGEDVLLRDKTNSEIRVPTNLLSDADKTFLKQGRLWRQESFRGSPLSLRRILSKDDLTSNTLHLLFPDGPVSGAVGHFDRFHPEDQRWVQKLRAAVKKNGDSSKTLQAWQDFAGYVR